MPLLRGREADRARATLTALSDRFLRFRGARLLDPSLSSGHAGIALFHDVVDRRFAGKGHREAADRAIGSAAKLVAKLPLAAALHGGIAGVGWVLSRFSREGEGDPCEEVDAALLTYVSQSPFRDTYDLISGLVGVGVYALERLPRASAGAILAQVVDRLAENAVQGREGIAWKTHGRWLPHETAKKRPKVYWDLGVAHGVPGVIAFLGGVCMSTCPLPTRHKAASLLDRAVPWLLAQALPRGEEGAFPSMRAEEDPGPGEPARLAWCYGDLGVSAALLMAAQASGERPWRREALRVALHATMRRGESSRVVDAGLCHGAAGAAHSFLRLYRETGDDRFAAAARYWVAEAIALRRPRGDFCGFAARTLTPAGYRWETDASFLSGAAGVGLALDAALTDREPDWDRVLVLSARR